MLLRMKKKKSLWMRRKLIVFVFEKRELLLQKLVTSQ